MVEQKRTLFVLLGGVVFTILFIGISLLMPYTKIENPFLYNGIIYFLEFGLYCLGLYFYRIWISKILWFGQAVTILIFITLIKIVLTVLLLYIIFSLTNRFVQPGLFNLIALSGPFVRGFIFELAGIGLAAKLFETDIFDKNPNENDRIIDDLK